MRAANIADAVRDAFDEQQLSRLNHYAGRTETVVTRAAEFGREGFEPDSIFVLVDASDPAEIDFLKDALPGRFEAYGSVYEVHVETYGGLIDELSEFFGY